MRTWTRATSEVICGGPCHQRVRKGDPLFELRIEGMKSVFRRCVACAGEPVPEELPALKEPDPIVPMAHIRTGVDALPFDYKLAQASREPGSDD